MGSSVHAPQGQATVLVADGDSGAREALRMILSARYAVVSAACAQDLLTAIDREPIQVIALEPRLPGAGGERLLRRLRHAAPQAALVLVTSDVTLDEAAEALRCGADDLIRKPADVAQVAEAVARALEGQRRRARLASALGKLARLAGERRSFDALLHEAGENPRLRHKLEDLLASTTAAAAAPPLARDVDSMAAPSASSEGAWT